MKYSSLILAVIFFSCSTNNSQSDNTISIDNDAVIEDSLIADEEPQVVTETVYVKDSDVNEVADVRAFIMKLSDSANNLSIDNIENVDDFLDKDYVFKGEDREKYKARMGGMVKKFKINITNMEIKDVRSSCNLAYAIVTFQKSIIERASGEIKVDSGNKVSLFVMHKDTDGKWRLLVQKNDAGFAHWFYMPSEG